MQAAMRMVDSRRAKVALGLALAIVTAYAGSAIAQRGDPERHCADCVDHDIKNDSNSWSTMQLILASHNDLAMLRETLTSNASRADKKQALSRMGETRPERIPYSYPSHYLAFITAYLQDEEVLPEIDWPLSDSLFDVRGKLTHVFPRAGTDLGALRPEQYDVLELRREFHADGPLDDPLAAEALPDAIRVIRENFERLNEGDALIIAFGRSS